MLRLLLPEMVFIALGVGDYGPFHVKKKTPSSLENNSKSMVRSEMAQSIFRGSMNRRPRSLKTVDAKEGPGAYQWASAKDGQGRGRSLEL